MSSFFVKFIKFLTSNRWIILPICACAFIVVLSISFFVKAQETCEKREDGVLTMQFCPAPSGFPVQVRDGFIDCICDSGPAEYNLYNLYRCVDCATGFIREFETEPSDPK